MGDHMDSAVPGEAGYKVDDLLGYALTSSTATRGIIELCAPPNASNGNHGLINQRESPPPVTTASL